MTKLVVLRAMMLGALMGLVLYGVANPHTTNADLENSGTVLTEQTLIKNGHLTICKLDKNAYEVVKRVKMTITAYTSDPAETDDTPFITASGKHVADGIIAINGLPFGTLVKIPEISGDKIYVVEDRMHARKGIYHADIWMTEKADAINFGAKFANVEIVES